MTTTLALFDLADLAPSPAVDCRHCRRPATTRVHAVRNLYGVMPTYLIPTTYRDLAPIVSAPCCEACAWRLADAWWATSRTCPTGVCALWAHTFTNPQPGVVCGRHHDEHKVVWTTRLEATP